MLKYIWSSLLFFALGCTSCSHVSPCVFTERNDGSNTGIGSRLHLCGLKGFSPCCWLQWKLQVLLVFGINGFRFWEGCFILYNMNNYNNFIIEILCNAVNFCIVHFAVLNHSSYIPCAIICFWWEWWKYMEFSFGFDMNQMQRVVLHVCTLFHLGVKVSSSIGIKSIGLPFQTWFSTERKGNIICQK